MSASGDGLVRAVLDALPDPLAVLDATGAVAHANAAWRASAVTDPLIGAIGGAGWSPDAPARAREQWVSALRAVLAGEIQEADVGYRAGATSFTLTAHRLTQGNVLVRRRGLPDDDGAELRRQRFLAEASALFVSSLDPEGILRSLCRMAVPDIADCCTIDLVGEDRAVRRVAIAHVDPQQADLAWELEGRSRSGAEAAGGPSRVIRTGVPALHPTVDAALLEQMARGPEHLEALSRSQLRSLMVVPLLARGRSLGAITFAAIHSGRTFDEADLAFAATLGERTGLALENARHYREAQEANRLKDEFLATLSHELRTPLNAIVGWAHVLRGGPLDKAVVARAVDTIDRNARAQTQLISDILDVSRIVTGKLRLSVGPVELPLVVEAALEAARPAAAAKEIHIEAEIDALAGPVSGDGDRLQQVVSNLLSNAVKYTPKGGRVRVAVSRLEHQVEIVIEDNGVGIGHEHLPRLFERFRQPESSTTRPHGGTGLGLAIVRHLVELHGGTVNAESGGRGQGAAFRILLPLLGPHAGALSGLGPEEARGQKARGARGAAMPSLDGVRVLVVDDEKDARDVIVAILEQRGAKTFEAASVEEALAKLDEERPDVLLSDIGLPEEDGYSLMRRIRALPREKGGAIPAAALTAYARTEDRMQALLAGFQVHVPKPVQPAELIAVVSSLAARKGVQG